MTDRMDASMDEAMDKVRIRVYYDFASTLCYLAHRVLSDVEPELHDLAVELEWRPIDLTMAAPWDRGDSFAPEIRDAVRNTGLALGFDVAMPDPWLDSRPASAIALRTATAAAESRWRHAVYASIFERKMPQLTPELLALAEELVGPEPDSDGDGYSRVEECTREAMALGITGVPTLLLDTWMVGGVYDRPSTIAILRHLSEQYRELGTSVVN